MDKATAQLRLDVTRRQISKIEGALADAKSIEGEDSGRYNARIRLYESVMQDLRKEEQEYQQILR